MSDTDNKQGAGHTITLSADAGGMRWDVQCPFDVEDESRPCWPCTNESERMTLAEAQVYGCNYEEWFGEVGPFDIIHTVPPVTFPFTAQWHGDHFTFHLSVPVAAVPVEQGETDG